MAAYEKINFVNEPNKTTPLSAANLNHMEDGIANAQSAADQAQAGVDNLNTRSYAPVPVTLAADMTDQTKNYLYLGSETGYDSGYLYYWDGTAWTKGNEYQTGQVITDATLRNRGQAADAEATGDAIGEAKSALTEKIDVVVKTVDVATELIDNAFFTRVLGSIEDYGGNTIRVNWSGARANYYTYYFTADEAYEIYCPTVTGDTQADYYALGILKGYTSTQSSTDYDNYVGTDADRYRGSDNNLPTKNSPVSVAVGDMVFITIKKTSPNYHTIYGLETINDYSDRLRNDLDNGTIKKPKFVYDDTVSDTETERLNIYLPAKGGFSKVNFAHSVSNDANYDVWTIHPVYAVDDNLQSLFAITVSGEFECALREDGASDFMGGTAHGDEMLLDIVFMLDGEVITPSAITMITNFSELRIIENSTLYNADDHTTEMARHSKEYVFTSEGIKINQVVVWKHSATLTKSYLAMFPVEKSITPKIITNNEYLERTFSVDGYFNENGNTEAISYSNGFVGVFAIPNWEINGTNLSGVGKFIVTDNSGQAYNKQYYQCAQSGSVSVGDKWRTETVYKLDFITP